MYFCCRLSIFQGNTILQWLSLWSFDHLRHLSRGEPPAIWRKDRCCSRSWHPVWLDYNARSVCWCLFDWIPSWLSGCCCWSLGGGAVCPDLVQMDTNRFRVWSWTCMCFGCTAVSKSGDSVFFCGSGLYNGDSRCRPPCRGVTTSYVCRWPTEGSSIWRSSVLVWLGSCGTRTVCFPGWHHRSVFCHR